MGNTVWVLREDQDEDDWDHSLLLAEGKEFKRLSKQLGVKSLDDLLDYSILNEALGGPDTDPHYLEPSEVRPKLEAYISAIKSGQSRIKSVEEATEELEDCLKKVIEAEIKQFKVRFAVVP